MQLRGCCMGPQRDAQRCCAVEVEQQCAAALRTLQSWPALLGISMALLMLVPER